MASNPAMTPWTPTTDLRTLRRLGKLQEELGELTTTVAACLENPHHHRKALTHETADVLAQVELAVAQFGLPTDVIAFRMSDSLHPTARPAGRGSNPSHESSLLQILGALQAIAARCVIQGIEEVDPSSGKTNRVRFTDAVADTLTQVNRFIAHFNLDNNAIRLRVTEKKRQMAEWEALCTGAPAP